MDFFLNSPLGSSQHDCLLKLEFPAASAIWNQKHATGGSPLTIHRFGELAAQQISHQYR
jgi:hypothetical protein